MASIDFDIQRRGEKASLAIVPDTLVEAKYACAVPMRASSYYTLLQR
jgi:hypothetical protein